MADRSRASRRDGFAARIATLPAQVSADPALLRRGRFLSATIELGIGGEAFLLRIVDGHIVEVREGPFVTPSADFALIADAEIWQRLGAAHPPPGDHDIFAFIKRRELAVVGNLHPFMAHLLYFKGVLGLLGRGEDGP